MWTNRAQHCHAHVAGVSSNFHELVCRVSSRYQHWYPCYMRFCNKVHVCICDFTNHFQNGQYPLFTLLWELKFTPLKTKIAWEKDTSLSLLDDMWDAILKQVHSSPICSHHFLIKFKVVHTAHISKIYPELSPNCDKYKSSNALYVLAVSQPWKYFGKTYCKPSPRF